MQGSKGGETSLQNPTPFIKVQIVNEAQNVLSMGKLHVSRSYIYSGANANFPRGRSSTIEMIFKLDREIKAITYTAVLINAIPINASGHVFLDNI